MYIIKFLYQTFILPPGIFILLLCFFSWRLFRRQRALAVSLLAMTLVLYVFSTPFVAAEMIRSLERRYDPPAEVKGDVILMLGAGATLDTPNIGGQGHLSGYAANRLLTTLELQRQLGLPVVVSGGQVYQSTGCEAEIAKRIMTGLGVPASKIFAEGSSLNTTENALFTKELIEKNGFQRPILITSAFHMARAVKQFEKIGISVIPYPADYQVNTVGRWEYRKFIPSADALHEVSLAVKEYLGLLALPWY